MKNDIMLFTNDELNLLEQMEIRGGAAEGATNDGCQVYCGGSHCGPWCQAKEVPVLIA